MKFHIKLCVCVRGGGLYNLPCGRFNVLQIDWYFYLRLFAFLPLFMALEVTDSSASRWVNSCMGLFTKYIYYFTAAVELNLVSLMSFPAARNRELNLTEEIGVKYSTLGVFLLNDGQGKITDALEQQYHKDASLITQAIFKRWLQGAGAQPVAWSTLVHVLRKMKLCALADEINNVTLLI